MEGYVSKTDDVGKLVMSLGAISKGFGGQGKRMGENESFNVTFRENADPEITAYFKKVYGETPKRINFYLPGEDIDRCIIAPYTAFNGSRTLLAQSDGEYFIYIANLDNPLDTRNPYLRNGKRISDGQRIPHSPTLDFVGKPKAKMLLSGQMFIFVKELLEEGVFQTMTVKFHTLRDRDMLRKRLEYIKGYAATIGVPLTAIPFTLTKHRARTSFFDPSGAPRVSEHFYLDLGVAHSIGMDSKHPLGVALSESWRSIGKSSESKIANNSASERQVVEEPAEIAPVYEEDELDGDPLVSYEDGMDEDMENEQEPTAPAVSAAQPEKPQGKPEWKKKLFQLSPEQKEFVLANLSPAGANAGVLPEYLGEFKDKSGVGISELQFDKVVEQIGIADEYLKKISDGVIKVDAEIETKAKLRRGALITAGLILKNQYIFY